MATIPYIKGFEVKPLNITSEGVVEFTDGTNTITPNQLQCQAYGYTYDKASGTCIAYRNDFGLDTAFNNIDNKIEGAGNSTLSGTINTHILGENNIVRGSGRNNRISGSNNEIANGVSNASVFGTYGIAERDGEVVIGGGGFSGAGKGYAQTSTILLTGTTTDDTPTNLFVNGDTSTTIIARESTSSFQGFEAIVVGVRTGGSSVRGNVNDRELLKVTGIVYLKAANQTTTSLGSFGTITLDADIAFSGTNDMLFQVTGQPNKDISWSCTLNIYEIKV